MKVVAALILFALSAALSYVGLIYGWGLTPKDWPIILASSASSLIVAICAGAVL